MRKVDHGQIILTQPLATEFGSLEVTEGGSLEWLKFLDHRWWGVGEPDGTGMDIKRPD